MQNIFNLILIFIIILFFGQSCGGEKPDNNNNNNIKEMFPRQYTADGSVLARTGVATYSRWFREQYHVALLFETIPARPQDAITSEQYKMAVLIVARDMKKRKLKKLFKNNLIESGRGYYYQEKREADKFIALLDEPAAKGDEFRFLYSPIEGTHVEKNGNRLGTIQGRDFMIAFFSIFLGPEPVDDGIKKELFPSHRQHHEETRELYF
jgi:hypothetical protein